MASAYPAHQQMVDKVSFVDLSRWVGIEVVELAEALMWEHRRSMAPMVDLCHDLDLDRGSEMSGVYLENGRSNVCHADPWICGHHPGMAAVADDQKDADCDYSPSYPAALVPEAAASMSSSVRNPPVDVVPLALAVEVA